VTQLHRRRLRPLLAGGLIASTACAGAAPVAESEPAPARAAAPRREAPADRNAAQTGKPVVEPRLAMLVGLLPLRSLGVDSFRVRHPEYDGRGVILAILDSGLDPAVPGFQSTTTGARKILDLRDFSGEGRVALAPLGVADDGTALVGGIPLAGFPRLAAFAAGPYYGGIFRERTLGTAPAADVNGNGSAEDVFPVVVAKASDGWVVLTDTDADGTIADEEPVHDWSVAHETLTYRTDHGRDGPVTLVVNLQEVDRRPILDFFVDNSGHGTHVAGIAAGHSLFDVEGFDGVAPGAQLLGLKISNNARGGISVTGSMAAAVEYAAAFAAQREMPLVINLSFGVGNETEGYAVIDSLVDAFVVAHPDVLFVISVGNDGPGLSTLGFPGSAQHALSVCALFPGVYAAAPEPGVPPARDVLGWWSARGGETAKPDVCAPGLAYSSVPAWNAGKEISGGTSMAAPQVAGAAALLQSAMVQERSAVRGIDLKHALRAGASPLSGPAILDEGAGVPNLTSAYRWLRASHQTGVYHVQALPDGGNQSRATAAYRRDGLQSPGDTLQRFVVTSVGGQPAARLFLRSDASWLRAPRVLEPGGEPITVPLTYEAAAFSEPGLYVGTAWAVPATDTLAGAAFQLTNTVVVPHELEPGTSFRASGMLTPAATARHFLNVPEGSGGLSVRLKLRGSSQEATLYLFEPSGQPQRRQSSAAVGGEHRTGILNVAAHDVVPGVYEVVVVAPPLEAARYELEAEVPPVAVAGIGTGPSVTLRNDTDGAVEIGLDGRVIGIERVEHIERVDDEPVLVTTAIPPEAVKLVVEVELPVDTWHRVTDFGVTLFDANGAIVTDGPLNYATGQLALSLDSAALGGEVAVELLPAFARADGDHRWSADVHLWFLTREAMPLALIGQSVADAVVPPRGSLSLQFEPIRGGVPTLPGYRALVEVSAEAVGHAASVRWGPAR
jgi:subtilisin family serine protease